MFAQLLGLTAQAKQQTDEERLKQGGGDCGHYGFADEMPSVVLEEQVGIFTKKSADRRNRLTNALITHSAKTSREGRRRCRFARCKSIRRWRRVPAAITGGALDVTVPETKGRGVVRRSLIPPPQPRAQANG